MSDPKKVTSLANKLFKKYNLKSWKFAFNRSRICYGVCHFGKKTIFISEDFAKINPIENTKQILLHEIAHYFTPGEGHNKVFKACCKKLGITSSTHFSKDFIMPPSKYKAVCECGKVHHIYQVRKGMVLVCLKCERIVKTEKIS